MTKTSNWGCSGKLRTECSVVGWRGHVVVRKGDVVRIDMVEKTLLPVEHSVC